MVMGVYSNEGLESLIKQGVIKPRAPIRPLEKKEIKKDQVRPSSIDLRVGGGYGYCLHSSSLPPKQQNLDEFFSSRSKYMVNFLEPSIYLHRASVYVFPLLEELALTDYLIGRANPKSTTGREDIHTRLITEAGYYFDDIPAGYKGRLWLEVCPRSFDRIIREGDKLSQLRISDKGIKALNQEELICLHREEGILYEGRRKLSEKEFEEHLCGDTVLMSTNLRTKPIGWTARKVTGAVDPYFKNKKENYFSRVERDKFGEVTMDERMFGVFCSNERIRIPRGVCAEMVDIDTGIGEFRTHYAGFFDPDFWDHIVFEMRNLGPAFSFGDKQKIAGFKVYWMKEKPTVGYRDKKLKSNYHGQTGPRLAKFFV